MEADLNLALSGANEMDADKKAYSEPMVVVLGDLSALTQALGSTSIFDDPFNSDFS